MIPAAGFARVTPAASMTTPHPVTMVVNVRRDRFDVYVGRRIGRSADIEIRKGSEWGNPFKVGRHGTIGEVLEQYERWLRQRMAADSSVATRLRALSGKRLGCWCAPKRCHGEVIVRIVRELTGQP